MQELQEAMEEVNDFYLEKHGRVKAAIVQFAEDKRVRSDKAAQDGPKDLLLESTLPPLRAEGVRQMTRRFFDLIRQRYLAVRMEREQVRKSKGRTRFPADNYCPYEEDGRAGPSDGSARGSEQGGLIYSIPINLPLGLLVRGPPSDLSTPSPPTLPWTPNSGSPDDSNPESATICHPVTRPISKKTPPRLNPLANPFPDPSVGIQTQPPSRLLPQPPTPILPPPLPLPPSVTVPGRHGPPDNTAPLLPPAV